MVCFYLPLCYNCKMSLCPCQAASSVPFEYGKFLTHFPSAFTSTFNGGIALCTGYPPNRSSPDGSRRKPWRGTSWLQCLPEPPFPIIHCRLLFSIMVRNAPEAKRRRIFECVHALTACHTIPSSETRSMHNAETQIHVHVRTCTASGTGWGPDGAPKILFTGQRA